MSETRARHTPQSPVKEPRPRLIAVVNESCTGCEVCVDFCPVDCIDESPPRHGAGGMVPPIRIREPECIGCQVCAKVCEELERNAIEMVPVDRFERAAGTGVTATALP